MSHPFKQPVGEYCENCECFGNELEGFGECHGLPEVRIVGADCWCGLWKWKPDFAIAFLKEKEAEKSACPKRENPMKSSDPKEAKHVSES